MSENKKVRERSQYFATTIYNDSAPDNWKEILKNTHIRAFTVEHSKDVNEDGTPKKPHWHVMVLFDSLKSKRQARELFDSIGGVGVENIQSSRGYARYLCHLDNPEKVQYNPDDVECFGGVNYKEFILSTQQYEENMFCEIIDFCEENDVVSFYKLMMFARYERPEWFTYMHSKKTYAIKEFLKSKQWDMEQEAKQEEENARKVRR